MRLRQGILAVLLAVAANGCTLVRYTDADDARARRDWLTKQICDLEQARDGGAVSFDEWKRTRADGDRARRWPLGFGISAAEDWDEVLAGLYAARSTAVVEHNPYQSITGTCVLLAIEGGDANGIGFAVAAPICAVAEIAIIGPVWTVRSVVEDAVVAERDLVEAARDLQRARALGFEGERAKRGMLWPGWGTRYLDIVGYDAHWLAGR